MCTCIPRYIYSYLKQACAFQLRTSPRSESQFLCWPWRWEDGMENTDTQEAPTTSVVALCKSLLRAPRAHFITWPLGCGPGTQVGSLFLPLWRGFSLKPAFLIQVIIYQGKEGPCHQILRGCFTPFYFSHAHSLCLLDPIIECWRLEMDEEQKLTMLCYKLGISNGSY